MGFVCYNCYCKSAACSYYFNVLWCRGWDSNPQWNADIANSAYFYAATFPFFFSESKFGRRWNGWTNKWSTAHIAADYCQKNFGMTRWWIRFPLSALDVEAQKTGKMPKDTHNPEYCSVTLAASVVTGFQSNKSISLSNSRRRSGQNQWLFRFSFKLIHLQIMYLFLFYSAGPDSWIKDSLNQQFKHQKKNSKTK